MKIQIAIPTGRGDVRIEAMESVLNIMDMIRAIGGTPEFTRIKYTEITLARNLIATRFLDSDADYLLMHDDDMQINPAIIRIMIEKRYELCGVYAPDRGIDLDAYTEQVRTGMSFQDARDIVSPLIGDRDNEGNFPKDKNVIQEVSWVGTGILLFHRKAFERLVQAGSVHRYDIQAGKTVLDVIGFFDPPPRAKPGAREGEDVNFCRRYREAGGHVMAYRGEGVWHFGMQGFHS